MRMKQRSICTIATCAVLLGACASREPLDPGFFEIDPGKLPSPDVTLDIPGLGPCTDSPDRQLKLNSKRPLTVLVHGCFGSSGQFRGLAQVLAFHGQQSACFTYDDRAELTQSATELRQGLIKLAAATQMPKITVIGHSQGALVARKALTTLPKQPASPAPLELVTISGPFSGIEAARPCGWAWLRPLSLGLMAASCHLITGAKWADITYSSRFIREPGELTPETTRYLKINTDERDSCRREENGRCVESDLIFSLAEQNNPVVDLANRTENVTVKAGHVEIVGDKRVAPVKLLSLLQQKGVLPQVSAHRREDFRALLAQIYQTGSAGTR